MSILASRCGRSSALLVTGTALAPAAAAQPAGGRRHRAAQRDARPHARGRSYPRRAGVSRPRGARDPHGIPRRTHGSREKLRPAARWLPARQVRRDGRCGSCSPSAHRPSASSCSTAPSSLPDVPDRLHGGAARQTWAPVGLPARSPASGVPSPPSRPWRRPCGCARHRGGGRDRRHRPLGAGYARDARRPWRHMPDACACAT